MKNGLLRRYDIEAYCDGNEVAWNDYHPCADGDWVMWNEVNKLLFDEELNIEVKKLREENARLRRIIDRLAEAIKDDKT